jgi:hypothetical protein
VLKLIKYLKKNLLIYALVTTYALLLVLRASGLDIWLPSCLITETTGYTCFGCGLNTAAIYLLRLEFAQAYMANPLIYLYVPIIIGWITFDFHKFRFQPKTTIEDE